MSLKIDTSSESIDNFNALLEKSLHRMQYEGLHSEFEAREIDLSVLSGLLVPMMGEELTALFLSGFHLGMLVAEAE